jgi:hypothetical protein
LKETRGKGWRTKIFFLITGTLLAFCGYIIVTQSPKSQAEWERRVRAAPTSWFDQTAYDRTNGLMLTIGRSVRVKGAQITFRGMAQDRILLDVVIPALDPAFPYRRNLAVAEAESGFRMAEQEFHLVSAGAHKLHLKKKTAGF